jgi:hypothetical protein
MVSILSWAVKAEADAKKVKRNNTAMWFKTVFFMMLTINFRR